ncbi:MAG: hypothetical protein MZV70_02905 [Desulfobacterales bacterium]|nr:hypothetical protein [Desulfobacterales bacterium]
MRCVRTSSSRTAELDRVARDEGDIAGALEASGLTLQRHRRRAAALEAELDGARPQNHRQHRGGGRGSAAAASGPVKPLPVRAAGRPLQGQFASGLPERLASADSMPRGLYSAGKPCGHILAQD